MKQSLIHAAWISACTAALLLASPAFAQNIAVVNGTPIPKAKFDEEIATIVKSGRPESTEMDNYVKDNLISRELFLQEANKRNLPQDPLVQQEIERTHQDVLIQSVILDYIKANPPTDAEMHAAYDEAFKNASPKEYHVHHILVDTEKEAKSIIAKLKAGTATFEDLAKVSKDTSSAGRGGDLDWVDPQRVVPQFGDAITHMQKGTTTPTPVQTKYGYHVIRLDDVRDHKFPAYDDVKGQLAQVVTQNKEWQGTRVKAFLADLKAKARIE